MTFQWRVYPRENQHQPDKHTKWKPLLAQELVHIPSGKPSPLTVNGLIAYADRAYLSCRMLMLAAYAVHPEALYCAAQTVEKYIKALLLDRLGAKKYWQLPHPKKKKLCLHKSHDLVPLALEVVKQCGQSEFGDPEFIELCDTMALFEVAGRYRDSEYDNWWYSLDLLTFLDFFVAHCRELLIGFKTGRSEYSGVVNIIQQFITQAPATNLGEPMSENPVMKAAHRAYLENNRLTNELRTWTSIRN